jgi:hypothetical protein
LFTTFSEQGLGLLIDSGLPLAATDQNYSLTGHQDVRYTIQENWV